MKYRDALIFLSLVIVAFCACSLAQNEHAEDDASSGLSYSVPLPITTAERDRISRMLNLSDAQLLLMQSEYERYQAGYEQVHKTDFAQLLKTSQKARAELEKGYTVAFAQLFQEFTDLEVKIRKQIGELDDRFIDAISTVLDESQLPAAARVRQSRERARCFPLYIFVSGAQLDLAQFIHEFTKPQEDDAALDELLAEYESKVTPLFVQLRKTLDDHATKQVWAVSRCQFDEDGNPRDQESVEAKQLGEEYLAQMKSGLQKSARLQKQIFELNHRYFLAVAEKMKMKPNDPFCAQFRKLAFPDAYPDPTDPEEVYESILKNQELDEETHEAIQAMWTLYRESYSAKNRAMEDQNTKWRIQLAETEVQTGYSEYLEQMAKLRSERFKLNAGILTQLMDNFGHLLSTDSKLLIENHLGRVEAFVKMSQPSEE